MRNQSNAAPTAMNEAERSKGFKRANLPDLEDYDEKLKALTVRGTLELGFNELHVATYAMYIKHHYNPAVVENFLGDEFLGTDRSAPMKQRMRTSTKEVHKLSVQANATVGNAGSPSAGKLLDATKPRSSGSSILQAATICLRAMRNRRDLQEVL